MTPFDLEGFSAELRARYAPLLVDRLGLEPPLGDVARYALAGGKRLRPIFAELVGRASGAPCAAAREVAIAVEYLHTASVLLDDLACMDGATERRAAPPAHVRFSEAQAILASVALLSRAVAILLEAPTASVEVNAAMAGAACATVGGAMATGQALELAGTPETPVDPAHVRSIHERKTASLFALAARLACLCAGAGAAAEADLVAFATHWGAAYQVVDDLEDRGQPGEERANLAAVAGVVEATAYAASHIALARSLARADATGGLGACVDWLERKLARSNTRP